MSSLNSAERFCAKAISRSKDSITKGSASGWRRLTVLQTVSSAEPILAAIFAKAKVANGTGTRSLSWTWFFYSWA